MTTYRTLSQNFRLTHALAGSLMLLAVLGTAPAKAGLTDGLIALYPLDETSGMTAADLAGTNNGTLNGNFTGSEWTTGKVGGGLQFTRTAPTGAFGGAHAGFIEANGLVTNGLLNDTGTYTFSSWVKWAPQQAGSVSFGYSIWGANQALNVNANVMRVGVDNDASGVFAHGNQDIGGASTPFNDEQWHLFTMALGTDGNADIYFDGNLAVSKAADGGKEREKLWSIATLFHFGMEMEANQATDPWSGTLDELAIWDRELSSQEISDLYNGGSGVSLVIPEPSSLVLAALGMLALLGLRRRRRR